MTGPLLILAEKIDVPATAFALEPNDGWKTIDRTSAGEEGDVTTRRT